MYDYLIIGSGLFGSVFARQAADAGKKVLVIDKRPNIAGNVYTEKVEGINFHKYGAHIFHTNNTEVWNYVNRFATFNRFTNSPVANYKGELYSMPFNMYTFNKMWGVVTPEEAAAKIEEQKKEITGEPQNLEEQAISLVGRDIYEKLVKGYTEKQWGRDCKELPAFIIKRLPVRLTFDNNYFNALYQGIPVGGYTKLVENLLEGIEVRLNEDYLENKAEWNAMRKKLFIPEPSMPILTMHWGIWNTVRYVLKMRFLMCRTFREMQRSIIQIKKHRGQGSLNTNGLSLEKMKREMICQRPLSARNILRSGSREMNHITRSMMRRTGNFTKSIKRWQRKRKISFLEAA